MSRWSASVAVLAALVVTALGGASAVAQSGGSGLHSLRSPVTDENFYFVMADRFENGTAANDHGGLAPTRDVSGFDPTSTGHYHGGDLKGMLDRIDYIQGLGTTSLWLTPSFKNKAVQPEDGSAGYHGYWITDFTQIDPHLGTNDDLKALIDAAHARGMKVYFDIITNHTADVIDYREGKRPAYVSKDESPYRTAAGLPFDDRDYAGRSTFPALSPTRSFPFTPFVPAGDEDLKVPGWLNDPTLYHNRGNTTFTGENSLYGDFFGLDDLFTEHPKVVDGMISIYQKWIADFGVDGFRIDTMKHVNDEFWQKFAPRVLRYARQQGKREFFMFGEVFDTTKSFTSHFTTRAKVQAVLDFPFQAAAKGYVADSGSATALGDFFAGDDWYTDADSNVYSLPTFLGNHDMGRIGLFLRNGNGGASDQEILARDKLAHQLMYFARGNPVVYYGDEQGFVGDGGDQGARQDMFPSQVGTYNDDDLIGTDATTADSNFDPEHPLYRSIADLAALTKAHPALRDGAQQHRYADEGPGVYAFSRIDRADGHEYVVALNNSEAAKTAPVPTYLAGAEFRGVYGDGASVTTDGDARLSVTVPPLSAVVYRSVGVVEGGEVAPSVAVSVPDGPAADRDRREVVADVGGSGFAEVTFQARIGRGAWTRIGTDDNAPYRVFDDVGRRSPGTSIQYRATVVDLAGNRRTSRAANSKVAVPTITIGDPPSEGSNVRGVVPITATVAPDKNDNVVVFYRAIGDGPFTSIGSDSSQPAYTVFDDVSALGLEPGTRIRYRAELRYAAGRRVTSEPRTVKLAGAPLSTAVVHYRRPAGDYDGWGLHLFGAAIADGVATDYSAPRPPTGFDANGDARFEIPLKDDAKKLEFIIHLPGGDSVPTSREPGGNQGFFPIDHPEVWLTAGDPTIRFSPPAP